MANQSIIIHDNFNIHDIIKNKQSKSTSPFLGLVRIFENGILNTDESPDGWLQNMTIAKGREYAALKLFNKTNTGGTIPNVSSFVIDAFGVGNRGATIDTNNNITLLGPNVCDPDLYGPIVINTTAISNSVGIARVVKRIEVAGPGGVAGSITPIVSNNSEYNSCNTYKTVVKCMCVIDNQEPSYLAPGEVVKIDEAMLYATYLTQAIPFAHICFAPKFIEKESVFTIEWYVIF